MDATPATNSVLDLPELISLLPVEPEETTTLQERALVMLIAHRIAASESCPYEPSRMFEIAHWIMQTGATPNDHQGGGGGDDVA